MNFLKSILKNILFVLFTGCINDSAIQPGEVYTPYLTSYPDNSKVNLKWVKPGCAFINIPGYTCPQQDPDYFEILISDKSPSNLKPYSKLKRNVFETTIENLENGKSYYFAIKAVKFIAYEADYNWDSGYTWSIFIMNLLNQMETKVVDLGNLGEWSPVDKRIVYQTSKGEILNSSGFVPTYIQIFDL
jgi:hypothetical protein